MTERAQSELWESARFQRAPFGIPAERIPISRQDAASSTQDACAPQSIPQPYVR